MKILHILWKKWLVIAKVIGNFQGQLILTIFYFLLFFPLGIFFRFFADKLDIKSKKGKTEFKKWIHEHSSLTDVRQQF